MIVLWRWAFTLAMGFCLAAAPAPAGAVPPSGASPQASTPVQAGLPVDVALVLAVDISLSMDRGEQLLQRQGYVEALRHPDLVAAIASGFVQRIAVAYVEWGSAGDQYLVLPWTLIEDRVSAEAAAARLDAEAINRSRSTAIAAAIDFAVQLFERLDAEPLRRVIDISGDGPNNAGRPVLEARTAALERGIVINGLPIMIREMGFSPWSIPHLDAYFDDCVIGGPAAFMLPVRDVSEFEEAIRRKLVLEIAGAEPRVHLAQTAAQPLKRPVDCLIGEKLRGQLWGD